jgi:hypothetical protein
MASLESANQASSAKSKAPAWRAIPILLAVAWIPPFILDAFDYIFTYSTKRWRSNGIRLRLHHFPKLPTNRRCSSHNIV